MIQQFLGILAAYFPSAASAIQAHPAVAVFAAFIGLALVDAAEGGWLAHKGKTFDADKFGIQTKLVRAEVLLAGAALFLQFQTSGATSGAFSLAVVAGLTPRIYVLLADVRDKAAQIVGLRVAS